MTGDQIALLSLGLSLIAMLVGASASWTSLNARVGAIEKANRGTRKAVAAEERKRLSAEQKQEVDLDALADRVVELERWRERVAGAALASKDDTDPRLVAEMVRRVGE